MVIAGRAAFTGSEAISLSRLRLLNTHAAELFAGRMKLAFGGMVLPGAAAPATIVVCHFVLLLSSDSDNPLRFRLRKNVRRMNAVLELWNGPGQKHVPHSE